MAGQIPSKPITTHREREHRNPHPKLKFGPSIFKRGSPSKSAVIVGCKHCPATAVYRESETTYPKSCCKCCGIPSLGSTQVDFLIRSRAANHADSNLIYGANRFSIDKEDFQQLLALHLPANFISKAADDLLGRGIDHVS